MLFPLETGEGRAGRREDKGTRAFVKRRLVDREADLYPGTRIGPLASRCPDRPNRKRYRWWPAT